MPPSKEGEEVSIEVSLSNYDGIIPEPFRSRKIMIIAISKYCNVMTRLIKELHKIEKEGFYSSDPRVEIFKDEQDPHLVN